MTKTLGSVVKSMDTALKSMNLEKVNEINSYNVNR